MSDVVASACGTSRTPVVPFHTVPVTGVVAKARPTVLLPGSVSVHRVSPSRRSCRESSEDSSGLLQRTRTVRRGCASASVSSSSASSLGDVSSAGSE